MPADNFLLIDRDRYGFRLLSRKAPFPVGSQINSNTDIIDKRDASGIRAPSKRIDGYVRAVFLGSHDMRDLLGPQLGARKRSHRIAAIKGAPTHNSADTFAVGDDPGKTCCAKRCSNCCIHSQCLQLYQLPVSSFPDLVRSRKYLKLQTRNTNPRSVYQVGIDRDT